MAIKSQEKRKLKPALLKAQWRSKGGSHAAGRVWCTLLTASVRLSSCVCPPHHHLVTWCNVQELSCSTHIIRKMPPQSAVQERLVGSSCVCRPMGPSRRPRELHTTTRRTTKHTAKATLHLEGGHRPTFHTGYTCDGERGRGLSGSSPDTLYAGDVRRVCGDVALQFLNAPRHFGQRLQGDLARD